MADVQHDEPVPELKEDVGGEVLFVGTFRVSGSLQGRGILGSNF